ncbi:hypothetical protein [Halorussus caseinilyticus]|uniref:Small CPxCG-related zinc finger protein n=1 Tax=Halorussus caseinilyticus TaxID=3034025 RepID=A0ABD5WH77_9EURY
MSESRTESGVYVCDECGEVSFGDPSCCDESASAVEATPVEHPDLSGSSARCSASPRRD